MADSSTGAGNIQDESGASESKKVLKRKGAEKKGEKKRKKDIYVKGTHKLIERVPNDQSRNILSNKIVLDCNPKYKIYIHGSILIIK